MELSPGRLLATPDFRRLVLLILIAGLLLWFYAGLSSGFVLRSVEDQIDLTLAAALGTLAADNPAAADALLDAAVRGGTAQQIERGRQLLQRFGYDTQLPAYRKPMLENGRMISMVLWLGSLPVFLFLPALLVVLQQYRFYRNLERLSGQIRKGLAGDLERIPVPWNSGVWSGFLGRLDQLILKLRAAATRTEQDKIYLRDSLADISHQLKTPLAGLIVYNDLLSTNDLDADTRRNFLDCSRKTLSSMEQLVRNLLKLARLETGTIEFRSEPITPRLLVEETWNLLSHKAERRRFEVLDELDPARSIKGDVLWIREALGNVIKNAIEHTAADGTVHVRIYGTPLFLRIVVGDNGCGIPEADLPRIFERFFRGSNSPRMESVGIGLSLARKIVRANGGELRARNRAEGSELVFTFYE